MNVRIVIIFLLLLSVFNRQLIAQEQKKIDSLKVLYNNTSQDSTKILLLCKIATKYWFNKPDTSISICLKALEVAEKINFKKGIAKCYHVIAGAYDTKGNPALSLDYNYKALKIREEIGDIEGINSSLNNIGIIYLYQKNYKMALDCYNKNLETDWNLRYDTLGTAIDMSNLAEVYKDQGDFVKALDYFIKSKKIQEKYHKEYGVLNIYYNIADILEKQGKKDEASTFAQKGLALAEKIQNYEFKSGCLRVMASINLKSGNNEISIIYGLKALKAAQEINDLLFVKPAAMLLFEAYKLKNDYRNAYNYFVIALAANDSIFNLEKSREINSLQFGYELSKKKKEIEILTKDKKLARLQTFLFGSGLILFAFIAFLFFRGRQKEHKANILLAIQKTQIEDKNEELYLLNEEISSQRDYLQKFNIELTFKNEEITVHQNEIEKQKVDIELKNKNITDSIVYASFIQHAMLPSTEILEECASDFFILYKPCDIVSGDFYWCKQIKNLLYIAAADCTGHGVPGAFMSMLGISLLNEIVSKRDTNPPNVVLNELRKRIKKSLHQFDKESISKDGMDIAFCLIDLETNKLLYSGANSPLYIVRKNEDGNGYSLIVQKADRMPIGVHPKDAQSFGCWEFDMLPGDKIYIFSDGYVSQFGGDDGKKLKSRRFQEALVNTQEMSLTNQKEFLTNMLNDWQHDFYQVDDILVIGLSLKQSAS
jgi:serine phosphatase RsbU (regulator of sigma subunit)